MKKRAILFFSIILLLFFASSVYAAGSSTENLDPDNTTPVIREDCDSESELRDRIKCRLETGREESNYQGTEEACRGLVTENACTRLYEVSEACYDKSEIRERISCLRSSAGIERAIEVKLSSEEHRRNYLVLLLYELQERAEKAVDSGRLTEDEAAAIITKIVETKRLVLEGKSREEIKIELSSLRSLWQETLNENNS